MMDSYIVYFLLIGMALGLILMTAIYNAVLYYYNFEKPFLYYALMQLGIVIILLYDIGIATILFPSQTIYSLSYEIVSLYTLFFIILFSGSFLQIFSYLLIHEKILKSILIFIVIDFFYYPQAIIFDNQLFIFILTYVLYLGYLRIRQKYQPAKFFFLGWSAFLIATISDFFVDYYIVPDLNFNPMIIGSGIEAILLAIALSFQIKEIKNEKKRQEKLLIHQSKLASMGEMLGNITHQWRQPLTHLSYAFMNIGILEDKKERCKIVKEGINRLEFMSQTIDDFKDFYAPCKEKEYFFLEKETKNILELIPYTEVSIKIKVLEEIELFNYKNEFKQVLLNLLSNASEALMHENITNPLIDIKINKNSISITDNAGGIKGENIEKVFEPYFTTKESGLGIGLYMSKLIVEKNMGGTLKVKNISNGVEFLVIL